MSSDSLVEMKKLERPTERLAITPARRYSVYGRKFECAICGEEFYTARPQTDTCGATCRKRKERQKKKREAELKAAKEKERISKLLAKRRKEKKVKK